MALLDGKVGIITGAASGIGAATARTLAREGARLVLTDIDDQAGLALAEEIGAVYLHTANSDAVDRAYSGNKTLPGSRRCPFWPTLPMGSSFSI